MVGILGCREAGGVKLHVERMVGNFRCVCGGGGGGGGRGCCCSMFCNHGTFCHFVTKMTKRAAMPARFVISEVVTNRAGIVPF